MIVGTVAIVGAVAALMISQRSPIDTSFALFQNASSEKQTAFIHFLAKYGKTYASKSEVQSKFMSFS